MNEVYHIEVEAKDCNVTVIVNGLPVFNARGKVAPVLISNPVNIALIGKDNSLKIILNPDIANINGDYSAKGCVKKYAVGDITGPESGEILKEFSFFKTPLGEISFDNNTYNFSFIIIIQSKLCLINS
jgi:hypothetical protein